MSDSMHHLPFPSRASTLGDESDPFNSRLRPQLQRHLVLAVVWSRHEPERIGEVLELPAKRQENPVVFGRWDPLSGMSAIHKNRPELIRRRPGSCQWQKLPNSKYLSREQLEIRIPGHAVSFPSTCGRYNALERNTSSEHQRELFLEIENVGRCALLHQGQEVEQAIVRAGDLIELRNQFLLLCVERSIGWAEWPAELQYPAFSFGEADPFGIVGESPACWELRRQLVLAAGFQDHVMVLGERGTGKEAVAQALHRLSERRYTPFVACDISAIPQDFVSTELFGNSAGFPGAGASSREGLVERASGGTLLLDEIGDLPREAAQDLRRFLEQGEFQRLGGRTSTRADVRVIGATNQLLEALPADVADRFRRRIHVPPLTQRLEDVPLIARNFLRRLSGENRLVAQRFFEQGEVANIPRESPSLWYFLFQRVGEGSNIRGIDLHLRQAVDWSLSRVGQYFIDAPEPLARPLSVGPNSASVRTSVSDADDDICSQEGTVGRGFFSSQETNVVTLLRRYRFVIKEAARDPKWNVSEPTAHRTQRLLIYKSLQDTGWRIEESVRRLVGESTTSEALILRQTMQRRIIARIQKLKQWLIEGGMDRARARVRSQDGHEASWGEALLEAIDTDQMCD